MLQVTWLILSPGVGLYIQLHYWSSGTVDGWHTLVDPPLVIANCKVEFIQSFFWFYSVPNLLVIQHLKTLYLGGNQVRVVCERVCRKVQECALKKSLATGSRNWQVAKGGTHVKHVGELKGHASWSIIGQNFQIGQTVSLRLKLALILVTSSSCQNALFDEN